MKNSLTLSAVGILGLLFVSGCHTIRPLTVVDNQFYEQVPIQPLSIGLILTQDYRNYKSTDRGNDMADSQTYYIGDAIAPLTVAYFKKAFKEVSVFDKRPDSVKNEDYFIQPEVRRFENDLSLSEQRINLILGAFIFDGDLKLVDELEVSVSHEGRMGFFSTTKDSRKIVGLTIQKALRELLIETEKEISKTSQI